VDSGTTVGCRGVPNFSLKQDFMKPMGSMRGKCHPAYQISTNFSLVPSGNKTWTNIRYFSHVKLYSFEPEVDNYVAQYSGEYMKKVIVLLALLALQTAKADSAFKADMVCKGTSRLNNLVAEIKFDGCFLTLQNVGNTDQNRVAPLTIETFDDSSALTNGVTFVGGNFTDIRRQKVDRGTYDLIVGPSAAVLLMKNEDGTVHDFFRLDCSH
jgi:hypothetical protein